MENKKLIAMVLVMAAVASVGSASGVYNSMILDFTDPAHVMLGCRVGGETFNIDLIQITSASGSLNIAPLYVDMFLAGWNTIMVSTPFEYQVSYRLPASGQQLGATWAPGTLYDLGAFIPADMTFAEAQADLRVTGWDNALGGAGVITRVLLVPEPASMSLLGLSGLALLRRRRTA